MTSDRSSTPSAAASGPFSSAALAWRFAIPHGRWWMAAIPYRRFTMQCSCGGSEVIERLNGATAARRWIEPFGGSSEPFEGVVGDDSFTLRRTGVFRRGYLPRVRARLATSPSGTEISGTMTLDPASATFIVLWFASVIGLLVFGQISGPRFAVPAALLVLVGTSLQFSTQACRTAESLEVVLDAPVDWT